MARCRQTRRHYPNQCLPRPVSLYGVTRRQWVYIAKILQQTQTGLTTASTVILAISWAVFSSGDQHTGIMKSTLRNILVKINLPEDTKPYIELRDILAHMCATFVQLPCLFQAIAGNGFLKNASGKDKVLRRSKFVMQVHRNLLHNLIVC